MERCLGPVSGMHRTRAGARLATLPHAARVTRGPHCGFPAGCLFEVLGLLVGAGGVVHVCGQVAGRVAARIASGELRPGARLPAERDLAAEYGGSADTVRRAVAVLRERGLIVALTGRGSYVAECR